MSAEQATPQTDMPFQAERPLIFMGGVGYDEQRNKKIAARIIASTGAYGSVITIPDEEPGVSREGMVVCTPGGAQEKPLPSAIGLMRSLDDDSESRFTLLHERRARELVDAIQKRGSEPVDAIFQSVDASTGILAMRQNPELFRRVVLLDPSSIIKLPSGKQYLHEEWRNGNLREMIRHQKDPAEATLFEDSLPRAEKVQSKKRSLRGGNAIASYISHQASMLHEVAQSDQSPEISIVASRFDHAYTPERLLQALVSIDDIKTFFITNTRHGLSGKQVKLDQLVSVLTGATDATKSYFQKLHFAEGVAEDYRTKIVDIVASIVDKK